MLLLLFEILFISRTVVADKQDILRACHSHNESYALSIIAGENGDLFEIDAKLNDLGDTALIFCVSLKAETVALKLIELGADVTHRTSTGDSALSWAANRNLPRVVSALLKKGADPNVLVDGMTPLYYSCRDNSTDVATILLEIKETDPNLGEQNGIGSLAHAVANGNAAVIRALLKKGANTELLILSGPAAGSSPVTLCKNAALKSEEVAKACAELISISEAIATKKKIDAAKESLVTICSAKKKMKEKKEEEKEVVAVKATEVVEGAAVEIEQALSQIKVLQSIKGGITNDQKPESRTALQIACDCEDALVGRALRVALFSGKEDPRSNFFEYILFWGQWMPSKISDEVKDL